MSSFGIFDPEKMTEAQKAFWVGMTTQRVANMWDAADFIGELKPEAKNLLRNADESTLRWLERAHPKEIDRLQVSIDLIGRADKATLKWLASAKQEDIDQLQRSIKFMEASKLFAKIFWFLVASVLVTFLAVNEKFWTIIARIKS